MLIFEKSNENWIKKYMCSKTYVRQDLRKRMQFEAPKQNGTSCMNNTTRDILRRATKKYVVYVSPVLVVFTLHAVYSSIWQKEAQELETTKHHVLIKRRSASKQNTKCQTLVKRISNFFPTITQKKRYSQRFFVVHPVFKAIISWRFCWLHYFSLCLIYLLFSCKVLVEIWLCTTNLT